MVIGLARLGLPKDRLEENSPTFSSSAHHKNKLDWYNIQSGIYCSQKSMNFPDLMNNINWFLIKYIWQHVICHNGSSNLTSEWVASIKSGGSNTNAKLNKASSDLRRVRVIYDIYHICIFLVIIHTTLR